MADSLADQDHTASAKLDINDDGEVDSQDSSVLAWEGLPAD